MSTLTIDRVRALWAKASAALDTPPAATISQKSPRRRSVKPAKPPRGLGPKAYRLFAKESGFPVPPKL